LTQINKYIANSLPSAFKHSDANAQYEYGDANVLFKVTPGFVRRAKV
jgi:hypothetical protein